MKTLLVTGSRHWDNDARVIVTLERLLLDEWHPDGRPAPEELPVLRHGAARGLDTAAASLWEAWGLPSDPMPAKWPECGALCPDDGGKHRRPNKWNDGTHCPNAGPLRNRAMCDKEPRADLVIAFRVAKLPCTGTRDCAAYAESVGLEVRWVLS